MQDTICQRQEPPERLEIGDELALTVQALSRNSPAEVSGSSGEGMTWNPVDDAVAFAADAIVSVAIEHGELAPELLEDVIESVANTTGSSLDAAAFALYLRAIASPRILQLPPRLGIEVHLRLLVALARVSDASLWIEAVPGQIDHVGAIGSASTTRRFRSVAAATIEGNPRAPFTASARAQIHGIPVLRWQRPVAAVVVRSRPDQRSRASDFLRQCAEMVAPVLERDTLLDRSSARERTLQSVHERRLLRVGFDLHDGALQDIAALASDMRLAGEQISTVLEGNLRTILIGRFDDLHGRLAEIDQNLRDLSHSLESSSVVDRPLVEVLRREIEAFDRRTGANTLFEVDGSFEELSASQRIALYRIVQEALSNVREHTVATEVTISLEQVANGVRLSVSDNGGGFDVPHTVVAAARRGRLGLVGMNERVRLLSGTFSLRSAPNSGTEVAVTLPQWRPLAAAASQVVPSSS